MSNKFNIPGSIYYGENALRDAAEQLSALGKKALIVTDKEMLRLGSLRRVAGTLDDIGMGYAIFDGVDHEPTTDIVDQGAESYKSNKCDFLIGLGGGSPIDTMKAIAAVAALDKNISDLYGKDIQGGLPTTVAIPTTAGTGSEVTQFTIITDSKAGIKMLLKGLCLIPDIAIVDYTFTLSAPPSLTAFTGLDALCHAVEAYSSRKAQPLSDIFALSAIKRITSSLPIAYANPGDIGARQQMALAATEAGIAFSNSSVTVIHGMSRPIGALFHVPHGLSNALLMERCLYYIKVAATARFAEIARHCGIAETGLADEYAASLFLQNIRSMVKALNVPDLAGCKIDKEEFIRQTPKMSKDAMASGSPGNTLMDLTQQDLITIYHSLWQGT